MTDIKRHLSEYEAVPGFVCPAEFWPALGYDGSSRYAAIYWEPCGDEACCSDGRIGLVGAAWPACWALVDHNFRPDHLAHWLLSGSETPAACWLVIDRCTEWAWLVPSEWANTILRMQHPIQAVDTAGAADTSPDELSFAEWLEALALLAADHELPSIEELEHQLAAERALYVDLLDALQRRQTAARFRPASENRSVKIA